MQSDADKVRCRWCGHKSRNVQEFFQHLADAHNRRDALESVRRLNAMFPLTGVPTHGTQGEGGERPATEARGEDS